MKSYEVFVTADCQFPNGKGELEDYEAEDYLDTVFWADNSNAWEVKKSLIDHDGYPDCIRVTQEDCSLEEDTEEYKTHEDYLDALSDWQFEQRSQP